MVRNGTPHIAALGRTLTTLEAVIADGGQRNVSALARAMGMPIATVHRQVTTLVAHGYLTPSGRGRHVAGARLLGMLERLDTKQVIANVAAPVLHELAERVHSIVQMGTFENDMVTYRIKTGRIITPTGASELFTKVGMQLEAYCSGIGKVLVAHLDEREREAYLAGGPFVALTQRTITDPDALRAELAHVRVQGFARDRGEIAVGLCCIALPIFKPDGSVPAAISVTQADDAPGRLDPEQLLPLLREATARIERAAFG